MTSAISYDARYDVFYMRPKEYVSSYADEDDCGVVTLRSIIDDSVVGMVIYNFRSKFKNGTLSSFDLPLPLDLSDPQIKHILITQ